MEEDDSAWEEPKMEKFFGEVSWENDVSMVLGGRVGGERLMALFLASMPLLVILLKKIPF